MVLRLTTAGSVGVDILLVVPNAADGNAGATVTAVSTIRGAAMRLVAMPPSELSASLGIAVATAGAVKVTTDVTVALVVAPPPPWLPPSSPLRPTGQSIEQNGASSGAKGGGGMSLVAIAAAVAMPVLVMISAVAFLFKCRTRRRDAVQMNIVLASPSGSSQAAQHTPECPEISTKQRV